MFSADIHKTSGLGILLLWSCPQTEEPKMPRKSLRCTISDGLCCYLTLYTLLSSCRAYRALIKKKPSRLKWQGGATTRTLWTGWKLQLSAWYMEIMFRDRAAPLSTFNLTACHNPNSWKWSMRIYHLSMWADVQNVCIYSSCREICPCPSSSWSALVGH